MSDESTIPELPDFSTEGSGTPAQPSRNVPQVEGYEIVGDEPIGGGGMGTVWRAIQLGTRQPVALKLINAAHIGSKRARQWFEREVHLAASLEHPNIARVYDSGLHQGVYYYAMQLIDGGQPLDQYVKERKLGQRQILELFEKICLAIQVAHQRGVIHIDLKPPNILMSKDGEPYVLDFGLAKSLQTDEVQLTLSQPGLVAGTLPYMSPEQAAGRRLELDTTTDVYSLGVILFELLTGHSPRERTDDPIEMRRRILQDPVRRPSKLYREVNADLEALVLKALADEPARRYRNAGDLADDIDNYLSLRPVTAKPPTTVYHLGKWVRRHQAPVAIGGIVMTALLCVASFSYVRITQERRIAVTERQRAEGEAKEKDNQRKRAEQEARRAEAEAIKARTAQAESKRELAYSIVSQGNLLLLAGRGEEANGRYTEALQAFHDLGIPSFAVDLGIWEYDKLSPPSLNFFKHSASSYSTGICDPRSEADRLPHSPFDWSSGVMSVAFSPNGRTAISGNCDGTVKLWEVDRGRELHTLIGHSNRVTSVAFSPDGKLALSGSRDGTVRLWDVDSGGEVCAFVGHSGFVTCVAFSPDGRLVLSGGGDGQLKLWDVQTGRELRNFVGHMGSVQNAVFSPDGRQVLSCSSGARTYQGTGVYDGSIKVWNLETGIEVRTFDGYTALLERVCLSPDGRLALSASWDISLDRGFLKLWDVDSGRELRTFTGDVGAVTSVAFSPDGRLALSGSIDKLLKLWDVDSGREVHAFRAASGVVSAGFSPDGRLVISGSRDSTITVWEIEGRRELRAFVGHTGLVRSAVFSPDGRLALSGSQDQTLRLWDIETGHVLHTFYGHSNFVYSVAISPDGRLALSGSGGRFPCILWELGSGNRKAAAPVTLDPRMRPVASYISCVAFSTDGAVAVLGGGDGMIRNTGASPNPGQLSFWYLKTMELQEVSTHSAVVTSIAFSPNSRLALSGSADKTVRLWELSYGPTEKARRVQTLLNTNWVPYQRLNIRELRTFVGHSGPVTAVALSPDGQKALSGSWDKTLKLWDVETGHEIRTFAGAPGFLHTVSFSPDGRLIVSAGGVISFWEPNTGREIKTFAQAVTTVVFSPSGQQLLSGGQDNTVRLWDFSRPARYRQFESLLQSARKTLQENPEDAASLASFGEWYAFRGMWDWASDLLELARKNGGDISSLTLGRCYWQLKEFDSARREFQRALDRKEATEFYLQLCLQALQREANEKAEACRPGN